LSLPPELTPTPDRLVKAQQRVLEHRNPETG
jgi:hypothetical protein